MKRKNVNTTNTDISIATYNDLKTKFNKTKGEANEADNIIIQKFNILLDYFKKFKKIYDEEPNNPEQYGYIDKLLFIILKDYLKVILKLTYNKPNDTKDIDARLKLLKNIYYDIETYYVDIDISSTSVKKKRSSYGVVKIGQFSKDDLEIVDRMLLRFHDSFKNKYIKDIEINKESLNKPDSFAYKFPVLYNEILVLKTKIQQLQKQNAKSSDIDTVISALSDKYKEVFNNDEEHLNLPYIVEAIEKNKAFADENISKKGESKPGTLETVDVKKSSQSYKLDFLELLHNMYLNDDVFQSLLIINKEQKDKIELDLLGKLINRVIYNTLVSGDKNNPLYITKDAYEELVKAQTEKREKEEADKRAEALRKAEEEEEEAEANRRKAEEEAEANRRKAEEEKRRAEEEALMPSSCPNDATIDKR